MQSYKIKRVAVFSMTFVLLASFGGIVAFAAIPEPKSQGQVLQSKGTKAEKSYQEQGRAGTPGYEWGRGLQFWQILLKPFVEYVYQWDNNIFFAPSGRNSDWINKLNAGLTAELPLSGGQHLLTGNYKSETEWFSRFDSQDHSDYTLGGGLDLNFVPFSLHADDSLRRTVDRSDTEFTNRVSREENTARQRLRGLGFIVE